MSATDHAVKAALMRAPPAMPLALAFASDPARARAVEALRIVLLETLEADTDPTPKQLKLAWWQEALAVFADGGQAQHPLLAALGEQREGAIEVRDAMAAPHTLVRDNDGAWLTRLSQLELALLRLLGCTEPRLATARALGDAAWRSQRYRLLPTVWLAQAQVSGRLQSAKADPAHATLAKIILSHWQTTARGVAAGHAGALSAMDRKVLHKIADQKTPWRPPTPSLANLWLAWRGARGKI